MKLTRIHPLMYWIASAMVVCVVFWTLSTALAQDSAEQEDVAANTSATVGYQGRLTNASGKPLTGDYEMHFRVYPAETGDVILWDSGVRTVTVADGLFAVDLGISQNILTGRSLWLGITVGEETLSPRQRIQSAPYALSLQPGAQIERDTDGDALTVRNVATGFAVRGESAFGSGVYGYTDESYAVYGYDGGNNPARGYGGFFYSENGVGLFGLSDATSTVGNHWAQGVLGRSTNGIGVFGQTDSNFSHFAGVRGESAGGASGGEFISQDGYGVVASTESTTTIHSAVQGVNWGTGYGGDFIASDGVALHVRRSSGIGNVIEAEVGPSFSKNMVFRVDTSGKTYADGPYSSAGADVAELLPAQDGLEPGDVLVVGADGMLTRSSEAYQTAVVGVYSTKPSLLGGVQDDDFVDGAVPAGKVPLAILGVVPTKVSAENGPIAPGDLLTPADLPGHAMRCAEVAPCFGRSLGKALEALSDGTGVIQVLVTLQ